MTYLRNPAGFRMIFAFLWILSAAALVGAPAIARAQPLAVLDPGHGGSDPGAVGCGGLEEAGAVLDVSTRLRTLLEAAGVRITMTRDTDVAVGLSARAALANAMGADVFFSNHSNSNAGAAASGTEIWVANAASARSVELATAVQAEMIGAWGLPDRGVKYADFVVVRDTTMPAALAEMAFTNRCTPDAALLADPAARQEMAEAQARAILAWLGVAPGTDGTGRGVVFEDQGVGIEDLSVRLPGATVTVVETGASATADSPDANWSFMLPAATYTIEASAPGHVTNRRTCVVTSGAVTWCSIGLFPEGGSVDAGASDAGVTASDTGVMMTRDAGLAEDAGTTTPPASCGCRVASRHDGRMGAWVLGLMLALVLRRRALRKSLMRSAIVSLLSMGCTSAPEAATEALSPSSEPSSARSERFAHLEAVHVFDGRDAAGPILSPEGLHVLVPRADYAALSVIEVESGERWTLVEGPRSGYEPRWQDDGSVAYRTREESATAMPQHAITLEGQPTASRMRSHGVHAWVESGDGEDVVLFRDGTSTRRISRGGDRYLLPSVAGDWVSYWGVETGVFAYQASTDRTVVLGDPILSGEGSFGHPRFAPGGRYVTFERTTDDGHGFTSGDILLAELGDTPRVMVLTANVIARQPSLSRISQGRGRIAFLADDAIWVATLVLD